MKCHPYHTVARHWCFFAALRKEGVLLRHDYRRPGDGEAGRGGQGEHLRHRRYPGTPDGLTKNHIPLGHRRAEGVKHIIQ